MCICLWWHCRPVWPKVSSLPGLCIILQIQRQNNPYNNILYSLICPIFWSLIRCIKYIKRPRNALDFMDAILLHSDSPTCFGHSCGHLQGGENRNVSVIKMCLNHSTVFNSHVAFVKIDGWIIRYQWVNNIFFFLRRYNFSLRMFWPSQHIISNYYEGGW